MEWNKLKELVIREIREEEKYFKNNFYVSFIVLLDFLKKVIESKLKNTSLDGIDDKFFASLSTSFTEISDRGSKIIAIEKLAENFEAFLKKILIIIEENRFNQLKKEKKGKPSLGDILLELNVVDKKVLTANSIEKVKDYGFIAEHIYRLYEIRNNVHIANDFSQLQLSQGAISIVLCYLYVTAEYKDKIVKIFNKKDFIDVIEKIENNYKKWKSKFIHIEGFEKKYDDYELDDFLPYAVEMDFDDETSDIEREDDDDFDEEVEPEYKVKRKGNITDLRKEIKQMVILGPPGIGKTTTLQYLAYDIIKGDANLNKIPVFVELRHFTAEKTIENSISNFLNKNTKELDEILRDNKIILFFDGLNEVSINEQQNLIREIQVLIKKYNDLEIILSSRPDSYNNEFQIPVFMLQPMNDEKIKDFINKNYFNKIKSDDFYKILLKHKKLYEMSRNPLILTMLLSISVKSKGEIPENKGKLLQLFMDWIFSREEKQKKQFDKTTKKIFLSYLAFTTRIQNKVGFSLFETINIIKCIFR